MNDDALRRAYTLHLADRADAGRDRCPPPEALLAVVERRGSEVERLATLDHVGACAACGRDLELLRAVDRAGGARAAALRHSWMPTRWGSAAAAAALLVTVGAIVTLSRDPHEPVMRGGMSALRPISPSASASMPLTLVWHAFPEAQTYAVEILRLDGTPLFTATTADTALVVPDAPALEPEGEYLWSVSARLRDGTHVPAASLRFRLRRR